MKLNDMAKIMFGDLPICLFPTYLAMVQTPSN